MGMWNPAKDREPDKREEQTFKQFLISKYERKQWYKSPAEVRMEESASAGQENKVEAKLQPPPSSKVSVGGVGCGVWQSECTELPTVSPSLQGEWEESVRRGVWLSQATAR